MTTHMYRHAVLMVTFPGEPGLSGCPRLSSPICSEREPLGQLVQVLHRPDYSPVAQPTVSNTEENSKH